MTTWWGLWLFALAAGLGWWWTVVGAVAITAMFVFVSVPMMERRVLATRAGYAEYRRADAHAGLAAVAPPLPEKRHGVQSVTKTSDRLERANNPPASPAAIAWVVVLLASSSSDILLFELTGAVPSWLIWAKLGLLGVLILLSRLWQFVAALRPFLIILAAITSFMWAKTWLLDSSTWTTWQRRHSFTAVTLTAQMVEVGVALLLIGLLLLLRKRRQRFFLALGDMHAKTAPAKWLGEKSPGRLWVFGSVFTLVVVVGQFFMFMHPLSPTANAAQRLLPLIPVVLLTCRRQCGH